jgi:TadE-like protein
MKVNRLFRPQCGGQSLVEFTFVGIPLIFVLISVFEISRGMWMYHTLAYSVKAGVRYASVHGVNCTNNGNTCSVNMGPVADTCVGNPSIADVIKCAAIGLDPTKTQINFFTFTLGGAKTSQGSCTLAKGSCAGTQFPPPGANQPGINRIEIDISTPFTSALAMFWPGAKPVSFASGTLGATSADGVQF